MQRDVDARAAQRQAQERVDAETAARLQREEEAALARDPCNKVEMRRRLMEAANALPRARYGGRKLLDLTRGRSLGMEGAPGVSRMFLGQWSSGEEDLVKLADNADNTSTGRAAIEGHLMMRYAAARTQLLRAAAELGYVEA